MINQQLRLLISALLIFIGGSGIKIENANGASDGSTPVNMNSVALTDDFENAVVFSDLFPLDLSRWHNLTLSPNSSDRPCLFAGTCSIASLSGRNYSALSRDFVHSGNSAMKFFANKYDGKTASKAHLVWSQFSFKKGDTINSSFWIYIPSGTDITNMFLWDLEAEKLGDLKYSGQPGRRLYFENGLYLASDLGKWEPKVSVTRQKAGAGKPFPKDTWVKIDVKMYLSESEDGYLEVWQDGTKIISEYCQTLPESSTIYNNLDFGLTANGNTDYAQTIYIDDFSINASSNESTPTKDRVAPTIGITSPVGGNTVAAGTKVVITVRATDNVGLTGVKLYVNGSLYTVLKGAPSQGVYSTSLTIPWWGRGKNYSIQAKGYDAAGNIGTSSAVLVTAR